MSLADVIAHFSTASADGVPGGYVVTRNTSGGYGSTGLAVAGTTSTLTISACVQPYSGRGLIVLPEGCSTGDVRVIDTTTPLLMEPVPDSLVIRSETYTVFRVDGPTTLNGVSYYTAYAARQTVQA